MEIFHLMFVRFGLLSGYLLGNSCPLGCGWPCVLIVFCLFVFLFISHFGYKSGIKILIISVPVHCFSIILTEKHHITIALRLCFDKFK